VTVAQIWRKRLAVFRALKISPLEPTAGYAVQPFTVLETDLGNWIAGAVGHADPLRYGEWSAAGDVILWNPRTEEVRLRGETGSALICPFRAEPRLTIYGQGFAFFRAWADNRAAIAQRINLAAANHRATNAEPMDSGIPGALAIGDLAKIDWRAVDASVLVAGPGIDAKALNKAIIRSARLPRVESIAA
jgi:hypothetical protein